MDAYIKSFAVEVIGRCKRDWSPRAWRKFSERERQLEVAREFLSVAAGQQQDSELRNVARELLKLTGGEERP